MSARPCMIPPKPTYRFAAPARVMMLGDSIVQFGGGASGVQWTHAAMGQISQALWTNANFDHDFWPVAGTVDLRPGPTSMAGANQGVSGRNASDFDPYGAGGRWLVNGCAPPPSLSNTPATFDVNPSVKFRPDICVVEIGINDGPVGGPTGTIVPVTNITKELLVRGITPVLCTLRPFDSRAGKSALNQAGWFDLNNRMRAYAAATPGVYLSDNHKSWSDWQGLAWPWSDYSAWGNITGAQLADIQGMTQDGLHPSAYGGYVSSLALAPVLARLIEPANVLTRDHWGIAPNFISAGAATFLGAAGGKGAGITGSVATGWTASMSATSTAVASLLANPVTGGQSQQFVVTPSGTGAHEVLKLQLGSATFTPGSGVHAFFWAEIAVDGWAGWEQPGNFLSLGANISIASNIQYGSGVADQVPLPARTARTIWLRSPTFPAASAAVALWLNLAFRPSIAGTGTIIVKRCALHQAANPQPRWYYP